MAGSKELCLICAKPFYGKQKTTRCGGCELHFHSACLQISDTEQVFYTSTGKSTFQCEACTKLLCSTGNDDTPVRPQRSLSASDATCSISDGGKKIISPERELLLPELSNKESLSVQLEAVRLNGVTVKGMIENLVLMASTLTAEIPQVRIDNVELKKQIKVMLGFLAGTSGTKAPTAKKMTAERSLLSQTESMTYKDVVIKNQRMRQERAVSSTKNVGSSVPAAAVVSKDDDVSETNNEIGSADSPIDGYVVVTKKKRREGGMETPKRVKN
jgi:hypothetical protein